MECTQRLECTQELYSSQCERTCPEQIGFLGICGSKYPVKRGPNKIGRDPQTCNIVLDLKSISRQHAVINILSGKEYMLMDLDSANKTRLNSKILSPYIPQKLQNGDMVQFGEAFGVFRLLEDDNDLPMTQAVDIPDTPVAPRHANKLRGAGTTVPESPDVSDRDDSFIIPSQPKDHFKSPKSKFIKQSGKTIAIQPIGSNKIDNVYWNSTKSSPSLKLSLDSSNSFDESMISLKSNKTLVGNNDDIHEMETQPPYPNGHESTDSIYTAETQVPSENSPSIHSLDTQMPTADHLPSVRKINDQHDVHFDLYAANKENDISIFNAETQYFEAPKEKNVSKSKRNADDNIFLAATQLPEIVKRNFSKKLAVDSDPSIFEANTQMVTTDEPKSNENCISEAETQLPTVENQQNRSTKFSKPSPIVKSPHKINTSDEEILFDEVDNQPLDEDTFSQPLLPPEKSPKHDSEEIPLTQSIIMDDVVNDGVTIAKRDATEESDKSTDCEDFDILPTQKIPEKRLEDEDLTDCEDDIVFESNIPEKSLTLPAGSSAVNFEEMATQIIEEDVIFVEPTNKDKEVDFADLTTQVLPEDDHDISDLPTQVIDVDIPSKAVISKKSIEQQFSEEIISPFKIPLQTVLKAKKKDTPKSVEKSLIVPSKVVEDDKYYAATQDILEDLCSQRESSPEICKMTTKSYGKKDLCEQLADEEITLPFRNYKAENEMSPKKKYIMDMSPKSDGEDKVNKFVSSLSSKQIKEVIGVEPQVGNLKRVPSDPSDMEVTPKKVRPSKLMNTLLPDSQEIKTTVCHTSISNTTESSSDSEVENNSEEMTPLVYCKKRRGKKIDAKIDLTKKFDVEALPARVITRLRKPTSKVQESLEGKKNASSILKSTFLTEQEGDIDKDIICENISRLKKENGKKSAGDTTNEDIIKPVEVKKERRSRKKANDSDNTTNSEKVKNTEIKKEKDKEHKVNKAADKKENQLKVKNEKHLDSEKEKPKRKYSKTKVKDEDKPQRKDSKSSTSINNNSNLDSMVEYKSTRSTRSSRTKNDDSKNEKKSPEKEVKKRSYRKKATEKKEVKDQSPEKEKEVRRSRRQRDTKDKSEIVEQPTSIFKKIVEKPKSILKNSSHEQSAVYNNSSGSGSDSPKPLKRSAVRDIEEPSSKRTRSNNLNATVTSLKTRQPRTVRTHYVLFTAFPCDEVRIKLEKLGAVVVTDVSACTVVLTMQIKRTFKLLCAVGLGRPIVGPDWVQACNDAGMIVDPWQHLIKDEASEKRFQFSLQRTLTGKRNFLRGYHVSSTPTVMPTAPEMKLIVECSGGVWHAGGPRWVCVSCLADKALWPELRQKGATIVASEFILSGVLRQQVDVNDLARGCPMK